MAWEVVEHEGAGRIHAPTEAYEDAVGYLIARVDRYWEAGWRVVQFRERPPRVVVERDKRQVTLEVKRRK